ncbi:ParB/RepB/Spo0J family partition protein [Portibacter lacus]|uniref:Chromosome partitioning protein ParB n=1 Tax=Portibacter lacus TaxID=1099794 RepID=A0AA37WGK0_9BACT|nr:ParB/RepB/Spo0J family partition protein [Portibacter lacus]GLR18404.1 chromosome partitioning protein ParB [Portibacter lacus]
MGKKKELGKGIRALLNNIEDSSEEKEQVVRKLSNHIEFIDLENIEINPFQPRKQFDQEQLEELAESIRTYGIIQAITVRDMKDGNFQLISGERRFRASKLAGLKEVPAFIRIADDTLMLEMALVENIQRENLNALEVAISYNRLLGEFDFTHEQLSERVGKKRATISNYVRLLKLPPEIQTALKNETISMGHARALLAIDDLSLQLKLYKQTIDQQLSVRTLENLIKEYKTEKVHGPKPVSEKKHPEVAKMEKNIAEKIGYKSVIKRAASGKGEIRIPFKSDDELNNIIEALLN